MMKYHPVSRNFIPKDKNTATIPDIETLAQDHQLLVKENERLLSKIEDYKKIIDDMEEQFKEKEFQTKISEDRALALEKDLERYEDTKGDLDKVADLKSNIDTLNGQVQVLTEENEDLNEQLASYKDHVQSLYLILLILALL